MEFETIKNVFLSLMGQAINSLTSMTMTQGTWMFLGGVCGAAISLLALVLCIFLFPLKRRRLLKKLWERYEE